MSPAPSDPFDIAVIAGDGIGGEVVESAVAVVDAALGAGRCRWRRLPWGSDYWVAHGSMMPPDGLAELAGADAILLGAVGDPRVPDHVTLHGLLLPIRRRFDQFLCVRPVVLHPGVESPLRRLGPGSVDLVVYRENTEGEYADVGGRVHRGTEAEVAIQGNVFTRRGSGRIIQAAFEAARTRRNKVTSITKSNAQAHGMVLWDEVFRETAARYPDVATESLLVDAAAMDLVRRPEAFDVIVASNLFGDILSDLAAAVVGGLGLAPSANLDPTRQGPSMFEPVHGSAPDIAGQGVANPIATVLAAAMMLDHLDRGDAAHAIRRAVDRLLSHGTVRTPDLGGTARTTDVTRALIAELA